jgi:CHASE1-domain containing sensor protein
MVPVYQIAPIESNAKAVMFNLHVEKARVRALDDMLYYKVPALTAVLQLVQDEKERPSSILFVPVFFEVSIARGAFNARREGLDLSSLFMGHRPSQKST